jgi:hypothetical protein
MSPAGTARCPIASATRVYRRRRPERTVLYRLVQQHLETWLSRARESDPDGVPMAAHIERELRGFLSCGILACGFARARCGGCGHDFLVAFSCKGRGICPACTTRRMVETAARLVDHVFPQVPVRQWVITFPKRLRYVLHRDPALLNRLLALPDRLAMSPAQPTPPASPVRRAAAYTWVRLLARIYEVLPLLCPRCGSEMRLIAFIAAPDAIEAILEHLGEPARPPPLAARARAPPELDLVASDPVTLDQSPPWDPASAPADPGYEFEQTSAA